MYLSEFRPSNVNVNRDALIYLIKLKKSLHVVYEAFQMLILMKGSLIEVPIANFFMKEIKPSDPVCSFRFHRPVQVSETSFGSFPSPPQVGILHFNSE